MKFDIQNAISSNYHYTLANGIFSLARCFHFKLHKYIDWVYYRSDQLRACKGIKSSAKAFLFSGV